MFHLVCNEVKCLVNCGDFPGDSMIINDMISEFICSEYKEGLLKVIAATFI